LEKSSSILLLFLIGLSFSSSAQQVKTGEKINKVNVSYWNDNFLFEDLIDDVIRKGKDDHVTGSVSLEYLTGQRNNYWTYNCEFNILTNKNDNYRADLLTFLFSKTKVTSNVKIKTGLGIVGRGDFGGSEIQNFYHDLFGWRRIDLPYLSSQKLGLMFSSEIQYNFIKKQTYGISGNLLFNFISAAGASKVFPYLSFNHNKYFDFQLNLGYVNYYKTDRWLKLLFKRGFVWKLSASKEVFKNLGIGLWLSKGLYGIEEEIHYGMGLKF
jgi:hypothetical protein